MSSKKSDKNSRSLFEMERESEEYLEINLSSLLSEYFKE